MSKEETIKTLQREFTKIAHLLTKLDEALPEGCNTRLQEAEKLLRLCLGRMTDSYIENKVTTFLEEHNAE